MRGAVVKGGKGHCAPSKHQDTSNYPLHNVTFQKTRILNISTMEASNPPSIWFSDLTQDSDILVLISVHLLAARARGRGNIS